MSPGDYVQHRKTKRRGEILQKLEDGQYLVYSPHLGPLKEMWWAFPEELTRLLRKDEIGRL